MVPGGNPVIDVPGLRPISPLIEVDPVLVMVDPASTAKFPATPRFIADAARVLLLMETTANSTINKIVEIFCSFFMVYNYNLIN
jgi:hypothetical protein